MLKGYKFWVAELYFTFWLYISRPKEMLWQLALPQLACLWRHYIQRIIFHYFNWRCWYFYDGWYCGRLLVTQVVTYSIYLYMRCTAGWSTFYLITKCTTTAHVYVFNSHTWYIHRGDIVIAVPSGALHHTWKHDTLPRLGPVTCIGLLAVLGPLLVGAFSNSDTPRLQNINGSC